jgi:VWFA-related protein
LEVDSKKREFGIKGEGHSPRVVVIVAGTAARGAILAGPVGAAAMATVSLITLSGTRSRDVKLPRGLVFEVETADDLRIPFDTAGLETWTPSNAALAPQKPLRPAARRGAGMGKAPDREVVLAPIPESPVPGATRPSDPPVPPSAWTVRVDVDLVTVESVVRDSRGQLMEHLQKEDFRVFEDGVEKSLGHFSQDQLPLAVALVVDRSGSVARYREDLRQAALATLGQLKPEDNVALFSFADVNTRLSDLTDDRAAMGDLLSGLKPTGGTNIYDAVFDAAHYLSMAAPDRRRVVILISDNQANTLGRANESGAIRMALETETVVYSIKTQGTPSPAGNIKPAASQLEHTSIWICDPDSVLRIANETGGEMLDGSSRGLLSDALAAVIARLKLRYTLGYAPGVSARDGRFHRIEVKLVERFGRPGEAYTVHARRGFYAKLP